MGSKITLNNGAPSAPCCRLEGCRRPQPDIPKRRHLAYNKESGILPRLGDELIFDATVAGKDNRNEWNYDQGKKHNYNNKTLDDHKDHIHFAVKDG